jgi:hypothetical protein
MKSCFAGPDRLNPIKSMSPLACYFSTVLAKVNRNCLRSQYTGAEFGCFFERVDASTTLTRGGNFPVCSLEADDECKVLSPRAPAEIETFPARNLRNLEIREGSELQDMYAEINEMTTDEGLLVPTIPTNFPMADFVAFKEYQTNSKTGDKITIKTGTGLEHLKEMGVTEQLDGGQWRTRKGQARFKLLLDMLGPADILDRNVHVTDGTLEQRKLVLKHIQIRTVCGEDFAAQHGKIMQALLHYGSCDEFMQRHHYALVRGYTLPTEPKDKKRQVSSSSSSNRKKSKR